MLVSRAQWRLSGHWILTLTAGTSPINTGTGDEDVVYDGEYTFAADPSAISIFDLAIVEHRRLVELNGSTVDGLRKPFHKHQYSTVTTPGRWRSRYFIRVEVFPA